MVNIINEWFVEAANHCSGPFDYGEDEMALAGLTPVKSLRVKPPRVGESALHMECRVAHTYEVKDAAGTVTTTIVIGERRWAFLSTLFWGEAARGVWIKCRCL